MAEFDSRAVGAAILKKFELSEREGGSSLIGTLTQIFP